MGKQKKKIVKQELQNANMPSLHAYDLSLMKGEQYAPALDILFHSESWTEVMSQRNRICNTATRAGADFRIIHEGLKRCDKKAQEMLLQTLFICSKKNEEIVNNRSITLTDYFDEFVKTPEQKELYEKFAEKLDCAIFMVDIADGMLMEAMSALRELDPDTLLSEFDGIKQAIRVIKDFSSMRHKNEHEELQELWCDACDDIELSAYARYKTFMSDYKPALNRLISEGAVDEKTHRPFADN